MKKGQKFRKSDLTEIKYLYQSLSAALDSFICKIPIFIQCNQSTKSKVLSIKSAIDGILYGNGDQLWESFNQELDKRLEEIKRVNTRLKQNEYSSAEPKKIQKNANANESSILLKQKQQELYNLTTDYQNMKNSFSIQIQQVSQEIDKYKNDIEIINMQINSILNQIMARNRSLNLSKNEADNIKKTNLHRPIIRSNDSLLPQLNSSRQPIKLSSRVAFSASPHSNAIENNEIRYPVSEPQMNGNQRAFYRSNRNLMPVNNSGAANNDDSIDDMIDYNHICSYNSYDTASNSKLERTDNNINIRHGYSNNIGNSNVGGSTGMNFNNNFYCTNDYQYNAEKSNENSDNSYSFSENDNNESNYFPSSNENNFFDIKSDSVRNDSQKPTVCTIYINHKQEKKKSEQKTAELQTPLDEVDDYLNEIDEIISDNFEDQNNSDDD